MAISFNLIKHSNGGCSGFEPDSLLHLLSSQLFKPYPLHPLFSLFYPTTFCCVLQHKGAFSAAAEALCDKVS